MKKKSRIVTGLMTGTLILVSFGGGLAYADNGIYTEPGNATTSVTYQIDSIYSVSIPPSVELKSDQDVEETIKVTECNLLTNKRLAVSIADESLEAYDGSYAVRLVDENVADVELYSKITHDGSNINQSETLLSITKDSPAADMSTKIKFARPVNPQNLTAQIPAGEYTGTVTFDISCEDDV